VLPAELARELAEREAFLELAAGEALLHEQADADVLELLLELLDPGERRLRVRLRHEPGAALAARADLDGGVEQRLARFGQLAELVDERVQLAACLLDRVADPRSCFDGVAA
jgi:hypothetical protein